MCDLLRTAANNMHIIPQHDHNYITKELKMKGLASKRNIVRFLCTLFLAVILITPIVAEAGSVTIEKGKTKNYSVGYGGETITVTLSNAYTSVACQGKPTWVSSSKSGSKFTLTVSANTGTSSRSGDVVFRDGSTLWTLRITQSGKPVQKVTVSFNSNGGYGNVPSQTYVVGNSYGSLPSGPTPPTGKGFDGWYTASNGGSRVGTGTTVSASVTTLYAHYYTKSYTVSFNSNGGSSVSSKSVSYGSTYGSLATPTKSYHTFQGWYTASSGGSKVTSSTTMNTAADHTLYAHWSRDTIKVTFNNNGGYGNVPSKSYEVGSSYGSLPAGPTPPAGYSFVGWYTASSGGSQITNSTSVTYGDKTFYAHYSPITYTVSFNSNGGSSVSSKSVTYGTSYGTLPTPSRNGYTFAGWYTAASGGTQITSSSTMNTNANITLYAHWSPKSFTVSFDSNGGSAVSSKSVTYDSTYGTLPTPTRNGYTFVGWFTAASGGSQVTSSTKVTITGNQTLYAHWKGNTITVAFDNNGGYGNVPSQSYVVGNTYGSLPAGSTPPTGYSFVGWFTAKSGGVQITTNMTVSPAYTTLYAQYKVKSFKVSFDSDGGTAVDAKTVTYGSTYGDLKTPAKTNHTFQGWYTAKSGGSKVVSTTTVSTAADHTLYARWTPNTITVKFDNNGGYGDVPSQTYKVGSAYSSLPAGPTPPAGYSFAGWYTAKSGGTKIIGSSIASTTYPVLYAQYTPKKYTISFNGNGGSDATEINVTFGQNYGTLPSSSRKGYTFAGWYTAKSGGTKITASSTVSTAANQTLYAHWTANKYTVMFDSNGGSNVSSITVTYAGTYGTLPSPTRNGYTFQGWYTAKTNGTKVTASTTVSITADQVLYAHWKGNAISVAFDNNGGYGNVPNQTYTVGDAYGTLPAGTTGKTGYGFAGWYTAKSGGVKITTTTTVSPAYTTLYAHYAAKNFKVTFDSNGGSAVNAKTVLYDGSYGNLPTPTREFYIFQGWYTAKSGGTKVGNGDTVTTAADHTLYAHWKRMTVTTKFDNNGGYGNVPSQTYNVGDAFGTLPAGSTPPAGYTFAGWFREKSGGYRIATSSIVKAEDTILYAHYTPKTYTVSFNSDGGSAVSQKTVTFDSAYGTLTSPTKTGYTFAGWYTAATGGARVTATTKVSTAANHTLYARWTAKTFTITFNSNGGTTVASKTVTYNSTYGTLTSPTRNGFTFQGWYTAISGGTKITASTKVTITANQTLYAQWKGKPITIKFDSNGGYGNVPSQTYTVGEAYGSLPAGSTPPTGYTFAGWFRTRSGGYRIAKSTIVQATDTVLYAQYTPKTMTVTFDSKGGTSVTQKTVTYDGTYGTLSTPTRPGWNFQGWFTAETGGTKITASTKVTKTVDHKLYAQWKRPTINIKFDTNGGYGVIPNRTYEVGEQYGSLPAGATPPTGYRFSGWFRTRTGGYRIANSSTVLATDTTLYAQFAPKDYIVKFDSQGGPAVNQKIVTFASEYGELKSPTRSGYTFGGWYTEPNGGTKITSASKVTIAANHTLYAQWISTTTTRVTFSANYSGGSSTYRTSYARYGSTYGSLPAAPSRSGFEFDGWYTEARGGEKVTSSTRVIKAADHTLYAHWKVTVFFPDTMSSDIYVYGCEGCEITIPSKVFRNIDTGESAIIGWSTRMGVGSPDNGNAFTYTLPTNLTESDVNLYAVVSGSVLMEVPDWVQKKIANWMSKAFDPTTNYAYNKSLQTNLGTGYLSGQGTDALKSFKVGVKYFWQVGCGPLACYNALVYKGKRRTLADVIYRFENKGYVMAVPLTDDEVDELTEFIGYLQYLYPWMKDDIANLQKIVDANAKYYNGSSSFGTNPFMMAEALSGFGVSCTEYSDSSKFANAVYDAMGHEDKGFILCSWNGNGIGDGAHYRFFYTSSTNPNNIVVYNNDNMASAVRLTYQDLLSILGMNSSDTLYSENRFIRGFELK